MLELPFKLHGFHFRVRRKWILTVVFGIAHKSIEDMTDRQPVDLQAKQTDVTLNELDSSGQYCHIGKWL